MYCLSKNIFKCIIKRNIKYLLLNHRIIFRLKSLANIKLSGLRNKKSDAIISKTDYIDRWATKKIELYDTNKVLQELGDKTGK